MRPNPWGLSGTDLSQELPLNMSNASKNGISEEKSIRTVQNIPSSVKDVNKCIYKYEISEALTFKNRFTCVVYDYETQRKQNCSSARLTQFLLFLEPEIGLTFSTGAALEFKSEGNKFSFWQFCCNDYKLQTTKSPQTEIQKTEIWPLPPESLKNNFLPKTD